MARPKQGSYPAYFENYVNLVEADSVEEAINKYSNALVDFFATIPAEKVPFRYAERKWSMKEMLQHVIDTERIFAYRALCLARGEQLPLPGFDENNYATASKADNRTWDNLIEEFRVLRQSTDYLLQSFTNEMLASTGVTNGQSNNVLAICFMTFGHTLHHINVAKERYLVL